MNVGVIERRLIDELDDDTDESIEGSPRRISAREMNNHLRVSAERNGVDLGPRKDLAASLAEPYLAAPYLAEPYLGHKKRADSSGRENTFVADKVRELDVQATADAVLDLLNLEAEIIREGSAAKSHPPSSTATRWIARCDSGPCSNLSHNLMQRRGASRGCHFTKDRARYTDSCTPNASKTLPTTGTVLLPSVVCSSVTRT